MRCDKEEERDSWVIKDDQNHFANRNSIGKLNKYTWLYIAFKTFSPECRGYESKEQAEKAILKLNRKVIATGFDTVFRIEHHNLNNIIKEHKAFKGENMVICEKTISISSLTEAI